jgi:hypothetical protein
MAIECAATHSATGAGFAIFGAGHLRASVAARKAGNQHAINYVREREWPDPAHLGPSEARS